MGGSFGVSRGEAGAEPGGAASGVCRAMLGGIRGREKSTDRLLLRAWAVILPEMGRAEEAVVCGGGAGGCFGARINL
uniref:Uncharacterized protein n=1 Tax=Paraburkholderia sprentiae WSM5005 TaxID=754502 RepID=A0A1I9YJ73_9BURK